MSIHCMDIDLHCYREKIVVDECFVIIGSSECRIAFILKCFIGNQNVILMICGVLDVVMFYDLLRSTFSQHIMRYIVRFVDEATHISLYAD